MCVNVFVCLWKYVIKSFCWEVWTWINAARCCDDCCKSRRTDWIIILIISECGIKICFLASDYRIIIFVAEETEHCHHDGCLRGNTLVMAVGGLEVQRREGETTKFTFGENPILPFFVVDISIPSVNLPVRHREAAESLTLEASHKLKTTHRFPWLQFYTFLQTHKVQGGATMCCPAALTACPSSCSIFPDKYHPGQSVKDISLFLRHWKIL